MTKIGVNNNLTDQTDVVYSENSIELSWLIRLGVDGYKKKKKDGPTMWLMV